MAFNRTANLEYKLGRAYDPAQLLRSLIEQIKAEPPSFEWFHAVYLNLNDLDHYSRVVPMEMKNASDVSTSDVPPISATGAVRKRGSRSGVLRPDRGERPDRGGCGGYGGCEEPSVPDAGIKASGPTLFGRPCYDAERAFRGTFFGLSRAE